MKRRSKAQWCALFAEHEKSGQTAAAFCREREICPKYFGLRHKQLLDTETVKSMPSFVPVAVAVAGRGEPLMVEVRLGEALQLRVPASVPVPWLSELLRALRD